MVVKVRFARGPVVTRRKGKNSRLATLAASLLTMGSLICAAFGLWRVGADLGWAGGFVFPDGFLSHAQVWIGAAAAIQYGAWRLRRYAVPVRRRNADAAPDTDQADPAQQDQSGNKRATANV
jgi:hypothetical protein